MNVYLQRKQNHYNVMIITVQINTNTPEGKRLEEMLRQHPKTVKFIEVSDVTEPTPDSCIKPKDGIDLVKETINSISATESAKLAFERLGEKYNYTFNNKFTK